ncbi:hypothetical protein Cadr_000001738 [Camelus dromedarius]|uniref:Uncharacterized protein n=1 Tax=Camelus dromedarius TaxID=9838 RepID=A0A5N4EEV3_CAMDR|nr:hypothetical protein Cadr_000001738 [Camelus dromedarius]
MRPYDGLSAASLLGEPGLTGALSEAAAAGPPFHHTADTHAEQRASIKGSAAFVVPGAGWLLNFAGLLGLESENTLLSQQGPARRQARRLPWRPDTKIMPCESAGGNDGHASWAVGKGCGGVKADVHPPEFAKEDTPWARRLCLCPAAVSFSSCSLKDFHGSNSKLWGARVTTRQSNVAATGGKSRTQTKVGEFRGEAGVQEQGAGGKLWESYSMTSPRASVEILFTPLLLPELRPSLIDQRQMSASHLRHGAAELEDLPFSFHLPHTQLADQLHCVQAKSFQSERAPRESAPEPIPLSKSATSLSLTTKPSLTPSWKPEAGAATESSWPREHQTSHGRDCLWV